MGGGVKTEGLQLPLPTDRFLLLVTGTDIQGFFVGRFSLDCTVVCSESCHLFQPGDWKAGHSRFFFVFVF